MVKGQLKIQQMAFMLMAITLFFVLAGMFVMVFKFSGLKEAATALEEKNAILTITKLANSAEFSCEEAFDTRKTNCVDFDKVMILKKNIDKYEDFWGVKNIEIKKIYPSGERLCTSSNYPDCEIVKLHDSESTGFTATSFVSLCRKTASEGGAQNKCELAKLIVSYETR
ncbi:MAG: hypothetical protein ABH804_00450 [archaeon]